MYDKLVRNHLFFDIKTKKHKKLKDTFFFINNFNIVKQLALK